MIAKLVCCGKLMFTSITVMLKVEFNFHITTCTVYFVFFSTAFQNSAKTLKTLQTKRRAVCTKNSPSEMISCLELRTYLTCLS